LHVLSTPPAFVLSQDQTLQKEFKPRQTSLKMSTKGIIRRMIKQATPTEAEIDTNFGTGFTSTLLSSQRTSTHRPASHIVGSCSGQLAKLTRSSSRCQSASPDTHGESHHNRDGHSRGSSSNPGSPRDPTGHALSPALAGLTTLPGRFREVNPRIARCSLPRSGLPNREVSGRLSVPRWQREHYASPHQGTNQFSRIFPCTEPSSTREPSLPGAYALITTSSPASRKVRFTPFKSTGSAPPQVSSRNEPT